MNFRSILADPDDPAPVEEPDAADAAVIRFLRGT